MFICRDKEGIIHALSGESDTWCGWSRVWVDGEWDIVDDAVVTCLECVVHRARHAVQKFVAIPTKAGMRASRTTRLPASLKSSTLGSASSARGTTKAASRTRRS